jgi:phosphoribosylglycinamide formyltransferase
MEIQHIVSGFTPKLSSAPSIPIGKQLFSLKFPSLLSSSYPSIQSQNFEVLSGACYPISIGKKDRFYSSRRRVRCSSGSNTADPNKGNEVRDQVTGRRKKLAVFVSGGGSNFKSIHEASKRGSLHGDVIVLVTNKNGNAASNYPFTSICSSDDNVM